MKPFLVFFTPCRKLCFADELVIVVKTHLFSVHINHHNHVHFSLVHPKLHLQYVHWCTIFRSPSILFLVATFLIMQPSIKNVQSITVFGYLPELNFRRHVDNAHANVIIARPDNSDRPEMLTKMGQRFRRYQWNVLLFSFSWSLWFLCDDLICFAFKLKIILKFGIVNLYDLWIGSKIWPKMKHII